MTQELDEFELAKSEARAVTGVLASHPNSTDVHISSLSLTFHGQELLADTSLELNSGRRYGLIGLNGTGTRPFTGELPSFFLILSNFGLFFCHCSLESLN